MAALLASRRSSEGSLPPLNSYSPDTWQEDGSAQSPRLSSALRLLPIALFCGDVQFSMIKELLLAISPKLHDLAFTTINPACGQIAGYDLDEDLQDLSCFLEAGSRSFKERSSSSCAPPTIREESSFEEISAIIRLSRKYESAHLYHSAIVDGPPARLCGVWDPRPESSRAAHASVFGRRYTRAALRSSPTRTRFPHNEVSRTVYIIVWHKRHFTPDAARFDLRTPPGFLDVNIVGVLNLARAIESFSLLSGAIFACCQLAVEDLTNSFLRDVGGKETLPLEDIRALTCRCTHCRDSLDRIRQKMVDALHAARPSKPMHFPILQMSAIEWIDPWLCDTCTKMVETKEHEAREEIWSLLPCIVDEVVPGWAGKCPKHCAAFKPSEPLSDSDSEGSQGSQDCHMAGPVHDWMRYRRIRS
ncbi:hypothetical protein LXA43DRAFT_1058521 [Ganoderma leucocontextum]|nr:hypothetical protein LXA43DRAFT_1058521 [Ganoderma leucocontextum]